MTKKTSKKLTLVILAAGLSSRYKKGLKQLDSFGPAGEALMDYSIYDAMQAGFAKVVFVIRKQFKDDFKNMIVSKYGGKLDYDFVYQEINDLPEGFDAAPGRQKPWGTGHAVWAARHIVKEPFAVINADDFYGSVSYKKIVPFLSTQAADNHNTYAMVGFKLNNTMSDHGSVSRGICTIEGEKLLDIEERTHLQRDQTGSIIYQNEKGIRQSIDPNAVVSMNFWGFLPDFFSRCEASFKNFLTHNDADMQSEFFLPNCIKEQIKSGHVSVKVLNSTGGWLGVTHADDKPAVKAKLKAFCEAGLYPPGLF